MQWSYFELRSDVLRVLSLFLVLLFISATPTHASDDLILRPIQVAPHTYFVQGLPEMGSSKNQNFISNAGFVITPKGVVVVDALGSPVLAKKLIAEIKKITPQKIVAVIVTHYHADHVYGLQEFKKLGAKIYAQGEGRSYISSETARQRLIASRTDFAPWVNSSTNLISADVWIDQSYALTVGGVNFKIGRVGPAHAPEDLIIYIPSEKVLFAGDLVFRGRIPFVGNADSKGWLQALNEIESLNPSIVIPGHGAHSINPIEDIRFTREYLRYLRQSMARAAVDMDPFEEAYRQADWSEYEGMPLFRAANRMNAYNVYLSIQAE
ncbi:MAG: MBL fold metallo-hydrolase [Rhodoferax sp.]|uniref:MBL fold metallo-hydrolase n=1 Tax=Polynucleobacter sp. MG-Unter2-18 TaxID=2081052 RepID=UPI001BFCDC9D|nr:MBL fold metallo-hydrolase [Polynucleobacter sp. MG-Unter2-18]MCF8165079.1 MBL fold metallo-hydrolase [Rhodoferax sp.]MCF8189708.1 MBL fold metallo-hydrolase [Polynucleobacter sp.]QWD93663.1 MBL fold metallo-hydrolase [Polynucleobacter sp. MG-Unter2-18]